MTKYELNQKKPIIIKLRDKWLNLMILRILRKINAHDNLKYTFSINKNINNKLEVGVYTMNSSKSNFYGISFSTFFN